MSEPVMRMIEMIEDDGEIPDHHYQSFIIPITRTTGSDWISYFLVRKSV
jgi:hypothetical protein